MSHVSLNAADRDAVDALIEARMNPADIQGPHAARCRHIHALLTSLDAPTGKAHDSLVDVTLARIMQTDRLRAADQELVLLDDDQDALDALVDSGFRLDRVPASLRARAETADRLARLLTQTPIPTNPYLMGDPAQAQIQHRTDLIERTLSRVDRAPRLVLADAPAPRAGWFRLSDLVSIAAVLLIGVAIMWPLLTAMRGNAERADCQANFGAIASALGLYSNDYKGQMPVATAGFGGFNGLASRAPIGGGGAPGGGTWWNVGTPSESNSANLFLLPKLRYASMPQFACPGNPHAVRESSSDAQDWPSLERVSYSYYVMAGPSRPTWENAPVAVLADRSPVILRAVRREPINERENSPNHGGRGQQILRADGSASWVCDPVVNGDNIWLPRPMEVGLAEARRLYAAGARNFTIILWGNEAPGSPTDTFLGP